MCEQLAHHLIYCCDGISSRLLLLLLLLFHHLVVFTLLAVLFLHDHLSFVDVGRVLKSTLLFLLHEQEGQVQVISSMVRRLIGHLHKQVLVFMESFRVDLLLRQILGILDLMTDEEMFLEARLVKIALFAFSEETLVLLALDLIAMDLHMLL